MVIGRGGKHVRREEDLSYVAGYTILLDIPKAWRGGRSHSTSSTNRRTVSNPVQYLGSSLLASSSLVWITNLASTPSITSLMKATLSRGFPP